MKITRNQLINTETREGTNNLPLLFLDCSLTLRIRMKSCLASPHSAQKQKGGERPVPVSFTQTRE